MGLGEGSERDDAACVRKVVAKFAKHSNKDVLICWVRCHVLSSV